MKTLVSIVIFFIASVFAAAQPNPGENGDGSEVDGDAINGSVPIGSGLVVMIVLSAGYAAKKLYKFRKEE